MKFVIFFLILFISSFLVYGTVPEIEELHEKVSEDRPFSFASDLVIHRLSSNYKNDSIILNLRFSVYNSNLNPVLITSTNLSLISCQYYGEEMKYFSQVIPIEKTGVYQSKLGFFSKLRQYFSLFFRDDAYAYNTEIITYGALVNSTELYDGRTNEDYLCVFKLDFGETNYTENIFLNFKHSWQ